MQIGKSSGLLMLIVLTVACNNTPKVAASADTVTAKKDTVTVKDPLKEPIISVEETTIKATHYMVVKDTAATEAQIAGKLGAAYGKIGACMKKCNLKMAGAPAAWYNQQKAPFIIEAAVATSTVCPAPENNIYLKEVKAGKGVVAHFFGPYSLTYKGHDAVEAWLKKNNKIASGPSWEVYVTDPATVKDPYSVQTDIYYPLP